MLSIITNFKMHFVYYFLFDFLVVCITYLFIIIDIKGPKFYHLDLMIMKNHY